MELLRKARIQFSEKCDFETLLVSFTYSVARFSVTALPKGETVTADNMVEYLKDTGNRFRNLKKDKIAFKNLLLQMDNARPHSAERTRACLITLHSNFEIFQKGHPAVEFMIERRIFER